VWGGESLGGKPLRAMARVRVKVVVERVEYAYLKCSCVRHELITSQIAVQVDADATRDHSGGGGVAA
jgi:hypothetical protein